MGSNDELSRILMVDDDMDMLRAVVRRLEKHYDIVTAGSGDQGLEKIESDGPFPVIVSDMQMPGMDGIRFVQRARRKSPLSVFVMLTGEVNETTTLRAMNEGQVFRFITKPCSHEDLLATLEASWRQYHLINAEKQLLQKTLVGAVDAIVNIFETLMPDGMMRSTSIQRIVEAVQENLRIQKRWEYALASRLSLLGYGLVGRSLTDVVAQPHFSEKDEQELMEKACAKSAEVLTKIPRLKTTAEIIAKTVESTGAISTLTPISDSEVTQVGSTLLRVALEWESSKRVGLTAGEAISAMRRKLPDLHQEVVNCLEDFEFEFVKANHQKIPVYDLKVGMVIHKGIYSKDGRVLISEGRRLTQPLLEKLNSYLSRGMGLRDTMVTVVMPAVDENKILQTESGELTPASDLMSF